MRGNTFFSTSLFLVLIAVAPIALSRTITSDRKHIISDDILSSDAECQIQVRKRKLLVPYDHIFDFDEIIKDRKMFSFKCNRVLDFVRGKDSAIGLLKKLRDEDWVLRFSYSTNKYTIETHNRLVTDPQFSGQWYLDAVDSQTFAQGMAVDYVDINVYDTWKSGIKGAGSSVIIVDTGIEWNNTEFDSSTRFIAEQSYNYSTGGEIWSPGDIYPAKPDTDHGTATTSIIIASMNNNVCMTGVSPESRWCGRCIVGTSGSSLSSISHALSAGVSEFQVSSDSWGFSTTDKYCRSKYLASSAAVEDALDIGSEKGNNGLGVSYVFSSGNEGSCGVGTNLGLMCRNPNVICVGALVSGGEKAPYSSFGSSVFIMAAAAGVTKWGQATGSVTVTHSESCSSYGSGTSFSCPLVSGVILLMQSTTGNGLRRRDVITILASTATPIDDCLSDNQRSTCMYGGWYRNQAGYKFSNYYGFGLVNAFKAVEMAKNWRNTLIPFKTDGHEELDIQDGNPSKVMVNGGNSIFQNVWAYKYKITENCLEVDAVYVMCHWYGTNKIGANSPSVGNLAIDVISPSGTRSRITTELTTAIIYEVDNEVRSELIPEYLKTYAFWHENSCGTWTIEATYPDCSQTENTCGIQVVKAHGIKFEGTPNPIKMMYEGCKGDVTSKCVEPILEEGKAMFLSWLIDSKDTEVQTKEMSFALVFHLNNNIISYELGKAQVSGKRFSFVIPSIRELGSVPQNTFVCASRETPNNCIHLLDVGALEEVVPNNGNYNLIKISYKMRDVSLQSMNESEVFNTKIVSPNRGGIIHQSITNFIKWTVNEGGKAVCGDVVSDRVWVEMCIWRRGEDSCLQKFSEEVAASDKQVELPAIEYAGLTLVTLGCIDGSGNKLESWDSVEAACSPDKIWFDNINVTLADGNPLVDVKSGDNLKVTFDYDPNMEIDIGVARVYFTCRGNIDGLETIYLTSETKKLSLIKGQTIVSAPINLEGKCRVKVSEGYYAKLSDQFYLTRKETIGVKRINNIHGDEIVVPLKRATDFQQVVVSALVFNAGKGYKKLPKEYVMGSTTSDTLSFGIDKLDEKGGFKAVACVSLANCGTTSECAMVVFSNCIFSNEFGVNISETLDAWVIAVIVVAVCIIFSMIISISVVCTQIKKNKEIEEAKRNATIMVAKVVNSNETKTKSCCKRKTATKTLLEVYQ